MRRRLPPEALELSRELGASLEERLQGMDRDRAILIPQMIEAGLPDPETIVDSGLDAAALTERMVDRLTFPEHRSDASLSAFRRVVTPVLERLLSDQGFISALAPAYQRAVLAHLQEMAEALSGLNARYGSLARALDELRDLRRTELELLAGRFEVESPHARSDGELRQLLTLKAEEYRALRSEVEGIDDGLKRLANLKAAARDAIARVDLEEVEALLSRVQEVELEEAARTAELRAENALLRGRVDQAFRLLSATADSFAAIDPLEPARRRILRYFKPLRDHGLRYGGPGLARALDLLRPVLTPDLRAADAWLWAAGENWRAVALRSQGSRTEGAAGAELLAQAVATYRAALEVRIQQDHPVDWAVSQNNLGNALSDQGRRTEGAAGAELLAQAVAAYRAALQVRTRKDHPLDWAVSQNNLGNALWAQGSRTDGAAGAELLAQAVAAYRAALEVYTRQDHPVDWAMTQNNLGNALAEQSRRTEGAAGAGLLAQAVAAYRAALEVYTRQDHPVDWTMTQNNLGLALADQGRRTEGAAGAELLAQAVAACRAALEVRTRRDHPVQWALTQESLAIAERALADHGATADPRPHLEAALGHVSAALEVFDPEHMPYDHGTATRLRDRLLARLGDGGAGQGPGAV